MTYFVSFLRHFVILIWCIYTANGQVFGTQMTQIKLLAAMRDDSVVERAVPRMEYSSTMHLKSCSYRQESTTRMFDNVVESARFEKKSKIGSIFVEYFKK